ncbi:hypothetical protein P7K49_024439 [Saguinus oedipus]|uniref:Uncharacterized protein n=1 Tax=Saguinus oedipus TaxID=9490 RepID=A0ABQ9UPJ3_SAGOE|nr:hypothetical protein P7K49_024439 [Saguinus oedipus]
MRNTQNDSQLRWPQVSASCQAPWSVSESELSVDEDKPTPVLNGFELPFTLKAAQTQNGSIDTVIFKLVTEAKLVKIHGKQCAEEEIQDSPRRTPSSCRTYV